MRRLLTFIVAAAIAGPATAALTVGTKAPDFETTGAIAGHAFRLHLAEQLKKGPVVLYFFPKAFTGGCTAEAHAFSDATKAFKKAGAQVIGMSADDLPTLQKFSVSECRNAFPVASASPATIKAYDVKLPMINMTNRTSYVITRDGRIMMVHSDMDWKDHVTKSLAAVQALRH
ncbi:MAG: redoxin domain-containing protein [Pseudomonadota bacterium]|nr:redoxin domain-containing protein [Pseudomonadota bacterium]